MILVDETREGATWWEEEGRRIGAGLDGRTAALVIGPTPDDAAAIALGVGAAQSPRRRVVIADLAGDTPALQRFVSTDDAHGIVDSFRYGVSINRIAHAVPGAPNLFVLPSGSERVVDDEIYRNDRWRRLVAGFREVGALLLLVAPAGAPSLDALAAFTDGVIAGGEVALPASTAVIEVASPPAALPRMDDAYAADESLAAADALDVGSTPPRRRSATRWVLGGAGLLAVAAVAAALAMRLPTRSAESVAVRRAADSVANAPAATIDSAAASVAPEVPPVLDPADSARAVMYSVELAKFSTPTGALMRVRDELPRGVPAATFAVVPLGADGTLWYRVLVGVAASRAGADSTLAALRRMPGVADSAAGAVVSVPLAFRLEERVDAPAAAALVRDYQARGVPAYALRQADGTVTLYAGAFESAEQAGLFTSYLRAAGIEPALTYRIGRTL